MIKSLRLWWLQRKLERSEKSYHKYVAEAKGEERDARINEAIEFRNEKREEIWSLRSTILSDEADRLGIPVPPLSDEESWESGWGPGTIRMTVNAQSQLRQAIRNERREKWGFAAFILKEIVVPLIGGIGAIMGLLSLLHSFSSK